jgi:predicted branched-subunit amino acid permease
MVCTLSLAHDLAPRGWRRVATAQLTIDESTAMAVANSEDPDRAAMRYAFVATGVSVFVLWNLGTLLGALSAGLIGDPRMYGLDAAAAAAFLALLWPRLGHNEARMVAVVAGLLTVILIPLVSPGLPVLASALVAVVAGLLPRREP